MAFLGDDMIKNVEIIVALVMILLGLIMIFDGRIIAKKCIKNDRNDENLAVRVFKILGSIIFLIFAYLLYTIINN